MQEFVDIGKSGRLNFDDEFGRQRCHTDGFDALAIDFGLVRNGVFFQQAQQRPERFFMAKIFDSQKLFHSPASYFLVPGRV